MRAQYDPVTGLVLSLATYEGELSLKLLHLICLELEKNEQDTTDFVTLMECIIEHKVRIQ